MGKLQIVHKWEMSSGALHSFPIQDGQGLCIYVGTPASNWPTKIILTRDGQDTEKSTPWTKSNRFQSFCRSRQALVEANYSYLKLRPGNKQSQKKKKKLNLALLPLTQWEFIRPVGWRNAQLSCELGLRQESVYIIEPLWSTCTTSVLSIQCNI